MKRDTFAVEPGDAIKCKKIENEATRDLRVYNICEINRKGKKRDEDIAIALESRSPIRPSALFKVEKKTLAFPEPYVPPYKRVIQTSVFVAKKRLSCKINFLENGDGIGGAPVVSCKIDQ